MENVWCSGSLFLSCSIIARIFFFYFYLRQNYLLLNYFVSDERKTVKWIFMWHSHPYHLSSCRRSIAFQKSKPRFLKGYGIFGYFFSCKIILIKVFLLLPLSLSSDSPVIFQALFANPLVGASYYLLAKNHAFGAA
jgi:hypothetical protein